MPYRKPKPYRKQKRRRHPVDPRLLLAAVTAISAVAALGTGGGDRIARMVSNTPAYYANCSAARAAGAAPVFRWEPGYRSALDADNDGIGCEPYP